LEKISSWYYNNQKSSSVMTKRSPKARESVLKRYFKHDLPILNEMKHSLKKIMSERSIALNLNLRINYALPFL